MDFAEVPQDFQNEIVNIVPDASPTCQISPNPLTLSPTEKSGLGERVTHNCLV